MQKLTNQKRGHDIKFLKEQYQQQPFSERMDNADVQLNYNCG